MMDNDAIMDQIVRNLSFQVVAVPQNIVQADSTSRLTPLNVKIKVRKKHDAGLRHGVLSMPKVDTKSDDDKDSALQCIRLVSSDQTVISFDMIMEAGFDKVPSRYGLDVNNENDKYPPLSKHTDKLNNLPIFSKRNKDIFGKCKPGGCLDPPYGEDKYEYQPTQQKNSLPVKEDSNKLRSSSIFKNKIFKRRKKSYQDEDHIIDDSKKTAEKDSILSLNEIESLQTSTGYSNSIITYPHSPSSDELSTQEEKLSKKKASNKEKSRSIVIEDPGSYFIVPKKSRNRSNQSDYKIIKLKDDIAKPEITNIIRRITEPDNDLQNKTSEIDEVNQTSKISNIIPIPLLLPLNAVVQESVNYTEKNTPNEKLYNSSMIEHTLQLVKNKTATEIETDNQIKILAQSDNKINSENLTTPSQEQHTSVLDDETVPNIHYSKTESIIIETIPLIYTDETIDISYTTENNNNKIEEIYKDDRISLSKNDIIGSKFRLSLNDQNIMKSANNSSIESIMKNDTTNLDHNGDKTDIRSHPLVNTKEKSILAIATNISHQVRETLTGNLNDEFKLSENEENVNILSHNVDDLKHLWTNKNEPLKSMPDVIIKSTLSATINNVKNNDSLNEINLLSPQMFSYNTEPNQEYLKIKNHSLQQTQNILEHKKEEPKILHEIISALESETKLLNFSGAHLTKNEEVMNELTKGSFLGKFEKTFQSNADNDVDGSPEILRNKDFEDIFTSKTEVFIEPDEFGIHTKNSLSDSLLPDNKDDQNLINSKESIRLSINSTTIDLNSAKYVEPEYNFEEQNTFLKKSSIDTQNTKIKQQENVFDTSENNKMEYKTKESHKNTCMTEFTAIAFKNKENYSTQSISKNESLKYRTATTTAILNNQDRKYSNSLSDNIAGKIKQADKMECTIDNNNNEFIIEQTPNPLFHTIKQKLMTPYEKIEVAKNEILSNRNAEVLYKNSEPPKIFYKDIGPWKMDIALQSYIDENNERIIKSFDSQNVPKRHVNDTILVAQSYLNDKSNEINIPIDEENEWSVQIKSNKSQTLPNKDSRENYFKAEKSIRKKKIKIDNIPNEGVSDTALIDKDYKDVNKPEANTFNKVISDDIRDALNTIYEKELLPLQDIIRGLREEIDMLVEYQMRFKEKVQTLAPKRSRPLRLVYPGKKCVCFRRM